MYMRIDGHYRTSRCFSDANAPKMFGSNLTEETVGLHCKGKLFRKSLIFTVGVRL
jgi:hypothetical protein